MRRNQKKSRKRQLNGGFQLLEDRNLFAADLGAADLIPQDVQPDDPAAHITMESTNRAEINIEFNPDNGYLNIDGSDFRDNVTVFNDGVNLRVEATRTDIDNGQKLIRRFNKDAVTLITFAGHGADDVFVDYTAETVSAQAGDGNDYMYANGLSYLYGNDGNDTLIAGLTGETYLVGGNGNDSLAGNSYRNYLLGGAGQDYMAAGAGDDYMDGGDGNDRMYGSSGRDRMYGGYGDDDMFGDSGDDAMFGGEGRDLIDGGSDNDQLHGNGDRDVLKGGFGNDVLRGGDATDYIYGGYGNDALYGDDGWDALFGESGNDYLNGGHDGHFDYLKGGSGRDRFEVHGWWLWKEYDNYVDVQSGIDQLV